MSDLGDLLERVKAAIQQPPSYGFGPIRETEWWEWHEGAIDDDEPSTVYVKATKEVVFRGTFEACKERYIDLCAEERARAAIEAIQEERK